MGILTDLHRHDESWRTPRPDAGDLAQRTNREAREHIDAARLRSRYRAELARWDASGDDVAPW